MKEKGIVFTLIACMLLFFVGCPQPNTPNTDTAGGTGEGAGTGTGTEEILKTVEKIQLTEGADVSLPTIIDDVKNQLNEVFGETAANAEDKLVGAWTNNEYSVNTESQKCSDKKIPALIIKINALELTIDSAIYKYIATYSEEQKSITVNVQKIIVLEKITVVAGDGVNLNTDFETYKSKLNDFFASEFMLSGGTWDNSTYEYTLVSERARGTPSDFEAIGTEISSLTGDDFGFSAVYDDTSKRITVTVQGLVTLERISFNRSGSNSLATPIKNKLNVVFAASETLINGEWKNIYSNGEYKLTYVIDTTEVKISVSKKDAILQALNDLLFQYDGENHYITALYEDNLINATVAIKYEMVTIPEISFVIKTASEQIPLTENTVPTLTFAKNTFKSILKNADLATDSGYDDCWHESLFIPEITEIRSQDWESAKNAVENLTTKHFEGWGLNVISDPLDNSVLVEMVMPNTFYIDDDSYYVDPSDINPGTPDRPFLTAQRVVDAIKQRGPGDYVVYIETTVQPTVAGEKGILAIETGTDAYNITLTAKYSGGINAGLEYFNGSISNEGLRSRPLYMNGENLHVTIGDNIWLKGGYTDYGGGVYVESGKLTVKDGSHINQNYATKNGGAIYVGSTNASVNIQGGELFRNHAVEKGGAIYISNGTTTIANAEIWYNTTDANGAGLYIEDGDLSINGATLRDNVALLDGGAIYCAGGSLSITNEAKVFWNSANMGGGIYFAGDILDIENSTIGGDSETYPNEAMHGAGLYIVSGEFTLTNTSITYNETIKNELSYVEVDRFNGYYISGSSAGMYIGENTTGSITGGKIAYNKSFDGAGMKIAESANTLEIGNVSMYGNIAHGNGGSIFTNRPLILNGTKIGIETESSYDSDHPDYNFATSGAGVYSNKNLVLQSAIFQNNYANDSEWNRSSSLPHYGGALYIENSTLELKGNTVIRDGSASSGGSAVYAKNATVNITENTLMLGNSSVCVYVDGGYLNMTGGTIGDEQNKDNNYTGIYFNGDTLNISGGNFLNNEGASITEDTNDVYFVGNTFNFSGGTMISSERASSSIFIEGKGKNETTFTMSGDATITSQSTYGLWAENATVNLNSGLIGSLEDRDSSGGGVLAKNDSIVNMKAPFKIVGNIVGINVSRSILEMTGGTITKSTYYGGIEANYATLNLSGGEISYNHNGQYGGGGIDCVGTNITLSGDISINNNTASRDGGGINFEGEYNSPPGTLTMNGGSIINNTAENGSAVSLSRNGTFIMNAGVIKDNIFTSGSFGGTIDLGIRGSGGTFKHNGGQVDSVIKPDVTP